LSVTSGAQVFTLLNIVVVSHFTADEAANESVL